MNKKINSKIISVALLCTTCAYTAPVFAYTKDETVYSKLDANGEKYKTVVSSHIKNTEQAELINDLSDLLQIENTGGNEEFTQDGTSLIWKANKNDIYYQGESEKELPIECNVKYELDGEEIEPTELIGKSGKVKITIEYKNKDAHVVNVNGVNQTMYTPFVVVAGTIFKNENNKDIKVSNGKAINDGTKTIVVGIAMPGLQESLKIDTEDIEIPDSIEIEMDTTNFESSNIMAYVTPKVFEIEDLKIFDKLDEIYDKLNTLQSASTSLVDGTKTLRKGAQNLNDGTNQLSNELNSKLKEYEDIKNKATNKEEVKNQIIKIINDEMEKILPDLKEQAKEEAQNTIKNHKTELENSVVDTSMKYTQSAVNAKLEEIEKSGGNIITKEQEQQLINALANDIKEVFQNVQNDPQIKPLLDELQADMKKEAKNRVNSVIDSKKVNTTSLTQEQIMAYVQAYSNQIAQIQAINPNITDIEALQIIGVVSNSTLNSIETQIDNEIDAISAENATQIEQKIKAELNEYISKVTQEVADKFTNGNIEILKEYEKQIQNTIVEQLKQKLSEDSVINAYAQQAKGELNNIIDNIANSTAKDLAETYTETIAKEVANNLIEKQLKGELADSEFDKELSKYEGLINSKLNELDNGITTIKSALSQLTNGTQQLADGSVQLENGMTQFNSEGIEKICNAINGDVKNISTRIKKLTDLSKDYNNFTMLNEENDGDVKFIMIIDAIKKQEENENSKEKAVLDMNNSKNEEE